MTTASHEVRRHTFTLLSGVPGLAHGVFLRHGGVSEPPYHSLNAAWNCGDTDPAVRENLQRVQRAIGVERLAASRQVHGDTIHLVDAEALERAEKRPPVHLTPPGDALITALTGVGLLIKIADCQAVFLVDPRKRVIANIHSGWRGSVSNIIGKTVQKLEEAFGSRPEELLATVSPALGPCCAEFRNFRQELPAEFWGFQSRPEHFDFWAISRRQLERAGVRPEQIEIAGRCTVCGTEDFFSYRGEKTTGRMAAVIAWTPEG